MPGSASDDQEAAASRLDAVRIVGGVDAAPQVVWTSPMRAGDVEAETLVAGTGPAVEEGRSVLAQVWIGDGATTTTAWSSRDTGQAQLLTAGPGSVPAIRAALVGAATGSRVAVTASGAAAFGTADGNPGLGIAADDAVLLVVDVLAELVTDLSGTAAAAPAWAPAVVEADGRPVRLDTSAVARPVGRFQKTVLVAGTGPVVRRDMTVAVRALGQTYADAEPFLDGWDDAPTTFRVGAGSVVEGWDKMVAGSTVGSRILFEVPPALGYGSAGDPTLGIVGSDTLYYVVDVLAAA